MENKVGETTTSQPKGQNGSAGTLWMDSRPRARPSTYSKSTIKHKVFVKDWLIDIILMITILLVASLLVIKTIQGIPNSITVSRPPNEFVTTKTTQGFFITSKLIAFFPAIAIIVILTPILIGRARRARFQLQLLKLLKETLKPKGSKLKSILETSLKLMRDTNLIYVDIQLPNLQDQLKSYLEFGLW